MRTNVIPRVPPLMPPGLRVRMGIATGTLEEGSDPAASAVNDLAKRELMAGRPPCSVALILTRTLHWMFPLAVVSDVAWGGQILMCSTSFEAIKYQTEDLDMASKGEVHGRPSQGWWKWWKW